MSEKRHHDEQRASDAAQSDSDSPNFLREVVSEDLASGKHDALITRFPPEPNGYLHIGHAKAVCINFGLAEEFAEDHPGTHCNLRFDDTNPAAESTDYVEAIQRDIRWLGFAWAGEVRYASDYFEQLYDWTVRLIEQGKAYVDSLDPEQIRAYRGNYYEPGRESPYRDRPAAESLDLLARMRRGEFDEGAHVVRAKIDMQSPNLNLRDPLMYRILHTPHHRTGDSWHIYPMYDWAHGQSDAIEGVTHSLCSLEFENHRPLYDWFLEQIDPPHRPQQIEFARLNLTYTVLSKRRLLQLVREGHVDGWDDPRMPTLSAMRRRGYPPEAIRRFCERVGVARRDGVVDVSLLEHAVREQLNATTRRVMGVLRPLRVVIENYPEGEVEHFDAPYHPEDPSYGTRRIPFCRTLWVERDDFREEAPKKWFRLAPGREVRLRYACLLTCREAIKDDSGEVVELRCTWDPDSRGGTSPDGRKVRGTLHWVSAEHAVDAEVRLYDRLFSVDNPTADKDVDFLTHLNPDALEVLRGCKLEPSLATVEPGERFQLERLGYFCADARDSGEGQPVLNRTIALRDSWAKLEKRQRKAKG